MSVREAPIEVITRGERRRIWTPEQKPDIVMESLEPGGSPIAMARRRGIGSGLLYTWRRQMVEGRLKAPMPVSPSFVPVAALLDGEGAAADPPVPQAAPSAAMPGGAPALSEMQPNARRRLVTDRATGFCGPVPGSGTPAPSACRRSAGCPPGIRSPARLD